MYAILNLVDSRYADQRESCQGNRLSRSNPLLAARDPGSGDKDRRYGACLASLLPFSLATLR